MGAVDNGDDVTPEQAAYTAAFVRWLRTGVEEDRETMDMLLPAAVRPLAIDFDAALAA